MAEKHTVDLLALARGLAKRELRRPPTAYARLVEAVDAGEATFPLSDRDLVAAAQHAVHLNKPLYAAAALDELALRLASQEPIESLERAA